MMRRSTVALGRGLGKARPAYSMTRRGYAANTDNSSKTETSANALLTTYVSDMVSVNDHLKTAVENQKKTTEKKYPEFSRILQNYGSSLERQNERLSKRLEQLGGSPTSTIKQGISAAAGYAASLISAARPDPIVKEFRDNYTAFAMVEIANQMLFCTAAALGDDQTAQLAKSAAKENAGFLVEIQHLMPQMIVTELNDNYKGVHLSSNAVSETKKMVQEVWSSRSGSSSSSSSSSSKQ
eukprot:TRINITY_DN4053_c1_g3_i1.p1 TRINITY_DN4053_c1_g3~~TRINITY_DN4053_c1_g3_i1.p1  ORF type:complete len:239 (-),score=70.33 TRINITY_DN4053_c1_g3_i1:25-741(-)